MQENSSLFSSTVSEKPDNFLRFVFEFSNQLTNHSLDWNRNMHEVRAVVVAFILVGQRPLLVLIALDAVLQLSATVGASRALLTKLS
jgi:hypothetical protein